MFGAGDWALKRVLKFLVKKNFGRFLQLEVDLDQLDVQLGSGRVEIRDVLLNCDAVNAHLVRTCCRRRANVQRCCSNEPQTHSQQINRFRAVCAR